MNRMICYTKLTGFLVLIFLTSGNVEAGKVWQSIGPGPIYGGQIENITNNPVVGAVNAIAPHPTDANILYIATVAGGIWKTENAMATDPKWIPISDRTPSFSLQESLSTSDITFDLFDITYSTLVASHGRYSSYNKQGGARMGLIRTTDQGLTWNKISGTTASGVSMEGKNINSVKAYSTVVLASVDAADNDTCNEIGVFGSFNTGATWFQMDTAFGLPQGRAYSLEVDSQDLDAFYVGIDTQQCGGQSGIYKTLNFGQSWFLISSALSPIFSTPECLKSNQYEISIGKQNNVYVGIYCDINPIDLFDQGELFGFFRSGNGGNTWLPVEIPGTFETEGFVGMNPGKQGFLHRSLLADPTDANIIYIGGDRQPKVFSSLGNSAFSGRLFRGNVSFPPGSQWSALTHVGTASRSAPHADSRDMVFDAAGSLLEADDGGIYRMLEPRLFTSDWISANGNLRVSEIHSSEYDSNTDTVIAGLQDNGTVTQSFLAETQWDQVSQGDGGDVAVDNQTLVAQNQSIRYSSFQNLQSFKRSVISQDNQILNTIFINLSVVSGAAFQPQGLTPIALNQVTPTKMIIAGNNSLYESFDQGDNITEVGPGIQVPIFGGPGTKNIAYGSFTAENTVWVGGVRGNENGVFSRLNVGDPFNFIYATSNPGTTINGIVMDENFSLSVFWIEDAKVVRSINGIIVDITGNIALLNPTGIGQMHSIEHIKGPDFESIFVGTDTGVYRANADTSFQSWIPFGFGLPPVPIYSLEYNKQSNVLVAGTFGRGEYLVKAPLSLNDAPEVNPIPLEMNLLKGSTSSSLTNGIISLFDNFIESNAGQTLTIQTTPVQQPMNGLLTLNSNGSFSYQHDDSMTNSDEFYYRVCDNGTPVLCNDAKVNITIDFGSDSLACSSPNIGIPDGDPTTGVTDTITVMQSGLISDLNVALEINHSWVGDLIVKLTHVSTGTQVTLIDRPGVPVSFNGCDENNISAILDDASQSLVESQCESPMAINGRFRPNNALSFFINRELSGNWELQVTDNASGDPGALISWCLDPVITPDDVIFSSGFE